MLIPLFHSEKTKHRFFTEIDDEDYSKIKDLKWYATIRKTLVYAVCDINRKRHFLHRMIMNCPEDKIIDHIDGDGLNNKKSNLRITTTQCNSLNKKMRCDNKTGINGIYSYSHLSIKHNGKNVYFKTLEDADTYKKNNNVEHLKTTIINGFTFQYYLNGVRKTKTSKDITKLLEFREHINKICENKNGIRK